MPNTALGGFQAVSPEAPLPPRFRFFVLDCMDGKDRESDRSHGLENACAQLEHTGCEIESTLLWHD